MEQSKETREAIDAWRRLKAEHDENHNSSKDPRDCEQCKARLAT